MAHLREKILGGILGCTGLFHNMAEGQSTTNWCATGRAAEQAVCSEGPCDAATTRNNWFPASGNPKTPIRIKFIVFRDDNGGGAAATASEIEDQVEQLDIAFASYGFIFEQQTNTLVDCTRFNRLCTQQTGCIQENVTTCIRDDVLCRGDYPNTEEQLMKTEFAESPGTQLNVFVVHTPGGSQGFEGIAYFPWCDDATGTPGGIVIDGSEIGGGSGCGGACRVLVHEVGHALGLWHTHRGVSEVLTCDDNCREGPDSDGNCPTDNEYYDTRGDLCCDTPGTITKPGDGQCEDPYTQDVCPPIYSFSGTDFTNYMWYGGNDCWDHFTRQQSARMQCWTCNELKGWIDSPDCNYNDIPDVCEITNGSKIDCDEDGILDECEATGAAGACCLSNEPDDCVRTPTSGCCSAINGLNWYGLGTMCETIDCSEGPMSP